jgi:hypothetical protein
MHDVLVLPVKNLVRGKMDRARAQLHLQRSFKGTALAYRINPENSLESGLRAQVGLQSVEDHGIAYHRSTDDKSTIGKGYFKFELDSNITAIVCEGSDPELFLVNTTLSWNDFFGHLQMLDHK